MDNILFLCYFILKSSKQLLVVLLCEEYIAYIKIAIDTIRIGISYKEKKFEINIPIPPNVDTRTKPIDEQLAQVLDINPIDAPENKDLPSFNFEFLIMYIFILKTIPISTAVILVRIKPNTASSGR